MENEELKSKLYKVNDALIKLRRKMTDIGDKAVVLATIAILRTQFEDIFFDENGELNKDCLDDDL